MAYAAIISARKEAEKGMATAREAVALHRQNLAERVAASQANGKPIGIREDDADILFYHEALNHAKESWAYYVKHSFCKSINIEPTGDNLRNVKVPDDYTPPKSYREWFMAASWD
ncbi:hypothetical protein [Rhizobium phage RHEph12]|nr:hypothetical protein [Rhizobium phage RHEph12]